MVRLLLSTTLQTVLFVTKFQSHNGAIAARQNCFVEELDYCVSIPQWCDCCQIVGQFVRQVLACFNPTMVRLLLGKGGQVRFGAPEFQSHNGAIAAHKVCENRLPPSRVSIPQWCDCCER